MNNENLKKLYDNISGVYKMPDYETFVSDMQNEGNRRKLHETLTHRYKMPDYETFCNDMGFSGSTKDVTDNEHLIVQNEPDEIDSANLVPPTPYTQQPGQVSPRAALDYAEQQVAKKKSNEQPVFEAPLPATSAEGLPLSPAQQDEQALKFNDISKYLGFQATDKEPDEVSVTPPVAAPADITAEYMQRSPQSVNEVYEFAEQAWTNNTQEGRAAKRALEDKIRGIILNSEKVREAVRNNPELSSADLNELIADEVAPYLQEYQEAIYKANQQYIDEQVRRINKNHLHDELLEQYNNLARLHAEALEREKNEDNFFNPYDTGMYSGATQFYGKAPKTTDLSAWKFLREAEEIEHAALYRDGFVEGLGQKLGDPKVWSFGIADLLANRDVYSALNKFERGDDLSEEEEALLNAVATKSAVLYYYNDRLSRGYKAGQVTGESIPFMLSFMITGAAGAATGLTKTLLKFAAKKTGGKILKNQALKVGSKFIARELASAVVGGGLTATVGAPQVAAGTLERMTGNALWDFDEDGNIRFAGTEGKQQFLSAFGHSFYDQFIENFSELALTGGAEAAGKALKAIPGFSKALGKVSATNLGKFVRSVRTNAVYRELVQRAAFDGYISEVAEEYLGSLLRAVTDETTLADEFTLDNQIDTWLGLLPTSLFFGAIGGGTATYDAVRGRQNMREYRAKLSTDASRKMFDRFISEIDNVNGAKEAVKQVLANEELSQQDKELILRGIAERNLSLFSNEMQAELREADLAEMQQQVSDKVDDLTNQESGTLITVHLHGSNGVSENAPVYFVVKGKLSLKPSEEVGNGQMIIDTDNSDNVVYLRDNTGKVIQVDPKWLDLVEIQDPTEAKNFIVTQRTEEYNAKHNYTPGSRVVMVDAEGKPQQGANGVEETVVTEVDDKGMVGVNTVMPDGSEQTIGLTPHDAGNLLRKARVFKAQNTQGGITTVEALENNDGTFTVYVSGEAVPELTNVPANALDGIMTANGFTEANSAEEVQEEQVQQEEATRGQEEPQPVGKGRFGNIYQWVTGKAKEAADFLRRKQGGYLKGVFRREDIGDIDLAWGDEKAGLKHIIQKHIVEHDDFGSVEEAMRVIGDVIMDGELTRQADGIKIEKGGYRVALRETEDGHWVITAYDTTRKPSEKERNAPGTPFDQAEAYRENGTLVSPGVSTGKVTESAPNTQAGVSETSASSRIPVGADGKPVYEQAESPDIAWDALVEKTQDEEVAQAFADNMVANKAAALKKAEKAKPKSTEDIDEFMASEQQRKAAIQQAQSDLSFWQQVSGTASRRREAVESARREVARQAAEAARAEAEKERAAREEAARVEREALNGVPDIVEDTPANARARGYRRVNGHKVDRQEAVEALQGKEVSVRFSDTAIPSGHIAVMEADQLQPSHINGVRNPLHFIDEAQPKERTDEASIQSARQIAGNIRPEEITGSATAYTGAPTVNARGEAIQGNNRSAALLEMWQHEPEQAAKYKQYLIDHAAEFGLDPEAIKSMERPVLVNRLDVDDNEAIVLGQYVAGDTESGGTERIKPRNAVKRMGKDMRTFAGKLLQSQDEEAGFSALVDANGVEVLKWMNRKGYITPTQYASAFDSKGNLTGEAKNDLKGIMYQALFQGGGTHLEEMFNALPAKAQKAILATAFRDYDSPAEERMIWEIQDSIQAYYALSQDGDFMSAKDMSEARRAMENWKRQYALDDVTGESYLPAEKFSNFALLLATLYKGGRQAGIQDTFNRMYDLIQGTQAATLFETPDNRPRTLAEAIRETLNIDYNGRARSTVLDSHAATSASGERGSVGAAAGGERVADGERATDRGRGAATDSGHVRENPTLGDIIAQGGETRNSLFNYFTGTLQDLINLAKETAVGLVKKIIAPINDRLLNDLRAKGVEIDTSYNHVIDNNAIRHALKNHGGSNEVKRGQIPISDTDFERIGEVVADYDDITVETGKRGGEVIIYSKAYPDGTTIFVEEKRAGRKELAAVTMWKKKSPSLTGANRTEATQIPDLGKASADKVTTKQGEKQEGEADTSADSELNSLIDQARAGDKQAQATLQEYGIDWGTKGVYRFAAKGEVDSLLSGGRYMGRFGNGRVDATNRQNPTTASTGDYRITFKDGFDFNKSGTAEADRTVMKNAELGDGYVTGGYSLADVARIEERQADGTYRTVYDSPATETAGYDLLQSLRSAYEGGDSAAMAQAETAMREFVRQQDSAAILATYMRAKENQRGQKDKGSAAYRMNGFLADTLKKELLSRGVPKEALDKKQAAELAKTATDPALLDMLVSTNDPLVWINVIDNPHASEATLERLREQYPSQVEWALRERRIAAREALEEAQESNPTFGDIIAQQKGNKNTSAATDTGNKSVPLPVEETPNTHEVSEPISQRDHGTQAARDSRNAEASDKSGSGSRESSENARGLRSAIAGASREQAGSIAESWAKEHGLWIPASEQTALGTPFVSGNENDNYLSEDGHIYKVNNLMNVGGDLLSLFDRIDLHNKTFPESKYEFVGLTGFGNGNVYPVFRQAYVQDARMATEAEIDGYMRSLGFEPTGREAEYTNGELTISDLRPRNVLRTESGMVYVVDADFKQDSTQGDKQEGETGVSTTSVATTGSTTGKAESGVSTGSTTAEKIEDVGEKIGGARKDRVSEYARKARETEEDQGSVMDMIRKLPVSKVFGFDYAALRGEGVPNEVITALQVLRGTIPSKPRTEYRLKTWADKVFTLYYTSLKLVSGTEAERRELLDKLSGSEVFAGRLRANMELGGFDSGIDLGEATLQELGENAGHYDSEGNWVSAKGQWYVTRAGKYGGIYPTREAAVEALRSFAGEQADSAAPEASKMKFDVYKSNKTGRVFIAPAGKPDIVVASGFKSTAEALQYKREHQAELAAKYKSMKEQANVSFKENRPRVGKDWRAGKDVSAEEFRSTFGFRGVEFGNWTNQTDRQQALNAAYDALMDLSEALGKSPRALSLNGELGMAFGARGGGQAAAHYEAGKVVINLTKTQGAGTLAHEWWHAVDNYFSRQRGSAHGFNSEDKDYTYDREAHGRYSDKERKELTKAFRGLMSAINQSSYGERSRAYAKLKSGYWKEPTELGARAFSVWVERKLAGKGIVNDFLANNETTSGMSAEMLEKYWPYPLEGDYAALDEAFDTLFDTIQEKVDEETGNPVLFRVASALQGSEVVRRVQQQERTEDHSEDNLEMDTGRNGQQQGSVTSTGSVTNEDVQAAYEAVSTLLERAGIPVELATAEQAAAMRGNAEEGVRLQARLNALDKAAATIRKWLQGGQRGRSFRLDLPKSTQAMIRRAMGRDFDSHNITSDSLAHILKGHGQDGSKLTKESIPLREEDLELIPYIMTAPDRVEKSSTDISGRESVRFYKDLSNGYVVVVEKEYKNSPNDMETITMWAEKSSAATNARQTDVPDTLVRNAIRSTDTAKIRKDAEIAIALEEKVQKMQGDSYGLSQQAESDRQYAKASEVLSALHEAGFTDLYISRSITPFGVSTYIQGQYGLKYRISDHGVSNINRIRDEIHYRYDTPVDWLVEQAEVAREEAKQRDAEWEAHKKAYEERRRLADEKWERIKPYFAGLAFHTNDRTYQHFDEFASKGEKPRLYVLQKPSEKYGSDAFAYEWAEPVEYDRWGHMIGYGSAKPSVDFIEAFDEEQGTVETTRLLETPSGTVYGWTVGGRIYLSPEGLEAETPVHEYTHIWDEACRRNNPELWRRGVELMKQTPLWAEVQNDPNYADLTTEDEIATEVHARLTGKGGAERLTSMAKEAREQGTAVGIARTESLIGKLRKWLSDFWYWLKDTMTPWTRGEAERVSLEDFTNMPLRDLALGTDLRGNGLTAEESRIAEAAKANGTFMQAPNGKRTKLTEKQWLQVRTKAFKEWFGDWETNPEEASKVVDENGEPRVVYHGSPTQFHTFDYWKIGSNTGTADGRGFYFTSSEDYAKGFENTGGQTLSVFLNIRNPLSYTEKTISKPQLLEIVKRIDKQEFEAEGEHFFLSNYGDYTRLGINKVAKEAADTEYEYADNDVELVNSIISGSGDIELVMNAVSGVTGKGSMIAPKANGTTHYIVTSATDIKSATDNVGTFDGSNADIRFRIGESRKEQMRKQLRNKLTHATDEQVERTIAEIEKLGEQSKQGGDPKLEKAALHWASKGTVILPEDNDKIRQAVKVANAKRADFTAYDSPMQLIDTFSYYEEKQERIDPDTVKTLKNKTDYGSGITVYDVEDSEQGRKDMREIINSHFGKDSSPWCLLQGDGNGNLTEDSRDYWDKYDAHGKKVAFHNGKLTAFFASDDVNEPTWWDRQDSPHYDGVPVKGKIPNDKLGRSGTMEIKPDGTFTTSDVHRGNTRNGVYEQWSDYNGQLSSRTTYKDGQLDGLRETYHGNGQLAEHATYKDGKLDGLCEWWYPNGELGSRDTYKDDKRDGLHEKWNYNGQLIARANYKDGKLDGLREEWDFDGQLKVRANYKDGQKDGLCEEWDRNGQLIKQYFKDGKRVPAPSEGAVLYRSGDSDMEAVNSRFNEELESLTEENARESVLDLGLPNAILRSCGISEKPIRLYGAKLLAKARKHGYHKSDLKNLPRAINSPIAVFEGSTDGSFAILTELQIGDKKVLASLSIGKGGHDVDFNVISSVYGKSGDSIVRWINGGKLLYADKKKALDYLSVPAPIAGAQDNQELNSAAKIVEDFENPSVGAENLREGDGSYTDSELSYLNDPVSRMTGSSRRTGNKRSEFAARERARMVERVESLAGKLHLDNVEVVTDATSLEGRKALAKGFYDKRTGKITVVIPNQASVHDAEQTLLHEAVAHHGLRELFGEHFDTFLDNVYGNASAEIRAAIEGIAARQGLDIRTATEEYLASLAEETDFENVNQSWWYKIKQLFLDMLHKIGFEGFGGVELTDNELRYILWRSYENLAEPGRYRSILGEAKDVTMQHRLGVGNYSVDSTAARQVADSGSAQSVESVNAQFNEQLASLTEENADKVVFDLGRPSDVLRSAGVEDKPMKLYGSKVMKKMRKHGFSLDELKDLPRAVANPIAVFDNYRKDGNRSILTELKTAQGNFLVTLNIGKGEDIDFNIVSSVFGKGEDNVVDWIERGLATYINKEKALNYLHHSALRAEALSSSRLVSAAKVIEDFENPSVEGEKNSPVLFRTSVPFDPQRETLQEYIARQQAEMAGFTEEEAAEAGERITRAFDEATGKASKVLTALYDSARPLEQFQKRFAAEGALLNDNTNAYHDFFLSKGRVGTGLADYQQEAFYPLVDLIGRLSKTDLVPDMELLGGEKPRLERKLTLYLQAKEMIEAEQLGWVERGQQGFEEQVRHADGLTKYTPAEYVEVVEAALGAENVERLWEAVNKATRWTLDYQLAHGYISQSTYEQYTTQRKYYVPQRGFAEDEANEQKARKSGKRGQASGQPYNSALRKAKGRVTLADDPLSYMFSIAQSTVFSVEKNRTKQKAYNFCIANLLVGRSSGQFQVDNVHYKKDVQADGTVKYKPVEGNIPLQELFADMLYRQEQRKLRERLRNTTDEAQAEAIRQRIDELDELIQYEPNVREDYILRPTEQADGFHRVYVTVGGVNHVLRFKDTDVAAVLNRDFGRDYTAFSSAAGEYNKIQKTTQYISQISTQYNPAFAVTNFMRDLPEAILTNRVAGNGISATRLITNVGKVQPDLMHYVWKGSIAPDGKYSAYLKEFFKEGAQTGWSFMFTIEQIRDDVKRRLAGKEGNAFEEVKKWIGNISEWSELTTRFAEYVSARELGYSPTRAAIMAKESTVNFDRKGTLTTCYNLFSFFNATMQGTWKWMKVLGGSKKARRTLGAILGTFVAGGLLNTLLAPDDPDDDKAWSDYDRMNNIVFWRMRIPLPQFFRAFWGVGVQLALGIQGKKTYSNAAFDAANNFFGEVLPFSGMEFLDFDSKRNRVSIDPVMGFRQFVPSIGQPVYDVVTNRNFMGGSIHKEPYVRGLDDITPQTTLGRPNVNSLLQAATDWLYTLGGGDLSAKHPSLTTSQGTTVPYLLDWNPSDLEHLVKGYTGGVGTFAADLVNVVGLAFSREGHTADEYLSSVPVVNRLYKPYNVDRPFNAAYWELQGRVGYIKEMPDSARAKLPYHRRRLYEEALGVLRGIDYDNPRPADLNRLNDMLEKWNKDYWKRQW